MKIAYNPKTAVALTAAPSNNDITFDLPGQSIYVKGVKFDGKAYSIFKKYTSATAGGYNGLVPAPSYNDGSTNRFLKEDGTWGVPEGTGFTIVSSTTDGLAPKIGTVAASTVTTQADEWVLTSTKGATPTWRKLPTNAFLNYYRPILVNGTSLLGNNNTALNIAAGTNINLTTDAGKVTINNGLTKLSQLTDDILSGNYLPLTGGTMTADALIKWDEGTKYDWSSNPGHGFKILPYNASVFYGCGIHVADSFYRWQLAYSVSKGNFVYRVGDNAIKDFEGNPWRTLVDSKNYSGYLPFLNSGSVHATNSSIIYAPVSAGTANQVLISSGSGAPIWTNQDSISAGSAASATKLQTKRKIWGQDFDGTADVSDSLTGVTSINSVSNQHLEIMTPSGSNKYIYLRYNSSITSSVLLTGTYFGPSSDSSGKLSLGSSADKWDHVYAKTFIGNLDGTYVNKLTGYTKATSASDLVTTDTLNTALGKLEYKAGIAYSWYRTITEDDTDEIINKWDEVVDFVNNLEVDLTDEFVTRKTDQTIIGKKIFSHNAYGEQLTIHRTQLYSDSMIKFSNNGDGILGYIGIGGSVSGSYPLNPYWSNGTYVYKFWHDGNDGHESGLDADTLDGKHGKAYQKAVYEYLIPEDTHEESAKKLDTTVIPNVVGYGSWNGYDFGFVDTKFYQDQNTSKVRTQISYGVRTNNAWMRNFNDKTQLWSDWRAFAFTDSNITGNAATADKLKTARTLTVGDTGKTFDGSTSVSWNSTEIGFRHTWDSIITCAVWSRLCKVLAYKNVTGATYIINISATRNNVVYNNTYLVTSHHNKTGNIVLLGGSYYSQISVRVCADSDGNSYFEILDKAQSATSSTTQYVKCQLIPISCKIADKYTKFTSGEVIPEGFASSKIFETKAYVNSIQASNFVGNLIGNVIGNITGNADSATKLQTPRKIWGNDFDGTQDVYQDLMFNHSYKIQWRENTYADAFAIYPEFAGVGDYNKLIIASSVGDKGVEPTLTPKIAVLGQSGNVGIGTITPTQKLEVVGNTILNGNVGIGTTDISYPLNVLGSTNLKGKVFVRQDASMAIYSEYNSRYPTDWGKEVVAIQTAFDNQDPITSEYPTSFSTRCVLALQPRGGFIGIGTTSPKYTLDVHGTIRLTNSLSLSTKSAMIKFAKADGTLTNSIQNDVGNLIFDIGYGHRDESAMQLFGTSVALFNKNDCVLKAINNNVLIGTLTDNNHKLNVDGNVFVSNYINFPNTEKLTGIVINPTDAWIYKIIDTDGTTTKEYKIPHYGHAMGYYKYIHTNGTSETHIGSFISDYFGLNFHVGMAEQTFKFGYGNGDNLVWGTTLYGDGRLITYGEITGKGFKKQNSSDSYVLLGGGGHKAISDFLLKSEIANQELSANLTTITKSLTVTADWMDTGIKHTDLTTGTYIVQLSVNANNSTDALYDCFWSGVLTWFSGKNYTTTNDTETDEIILHRSGHAYANTIYLRTIMTTGGSSGQGLKLQIAANKNIGAAYTYTFKFKRII